MKRNLKKFIKKLFLLLLVFQQIVFLSVPMHIVKAEETAGSEVNKSVSTNNTEIEKAKTQPKVYIAGDSTVMTYPIQFAPQAGWGQYISDSFSTDVTFENHAIGGRSSKSFIVEGRLDEIVNKIEPNDYLFIQFGHNDAVKSKADRYTDPHTTYKEYLKKYIEAAKQHNAIPVLITPVGRLNYKEGTFKNDFSVYCEAMKQVAEEENVKCIDLMTKSLNLYTSVGYKEAHTYFMVSANNKDCTHFTEKGAKEIAKLVTQGIQEAELPISKFIAAPKPARQMENLDRGVVAVKVSNGVFVSWRVLGTEDAAVTYNVYRDGTKINTAPVTNGNYLDAEGTLDSSYSISAVINGQEQAPSAAVKVWGNNYLSIPLQVPEAGTAPDGSEYTYSANDCSVGDLDGDHQYEIIVKWNPSNAKDNSQKGYTGNVYLDAYKLDGTRLWRIDLGRSIRAGAHYTQFMVYDLDGDGKAEVACKTADGTVDGTRQVIGDSVADYRNSNGYILSGPEYLTVFNGQTGAAISTINYEPGRGEVSSWGDAYGNRVDRFLSCIAYLDGVHPSLVTCRGYYTRAALAAYDWKNGELTKRWTFDTNDSGNEQYRGQGNHNLAVGDVDGDGKDEITYGACAIDDDGKGLYTIGLKHGDALHLGDLDPTRIGLEVWDAHEDAPYGADFRDAKTGDVLWRVTGSHDTGRAMAADIDSSHPGVEVWTAGMGLYDCKGKLISEAAPKSDNFSVWWDGDLQRELLDGNHIDKWNAKTHKTENVLTASECAGNNSTKEIPCLSADLFGDWREEVVWRTADSKELHIYTTTDMTKNRIYTLMQDPIYRLSIAWQNVGYNQPPMPGFYLGEGIRT